jgi:hypothetical protein
LNSGFPPRRGWPISVGSNMTPLKQYGLVRVRKLLKTPEHYNGWGINQKPPAIGDIGTLIDILTAKGLPNSFVVESSGPDGVSIWLGDFSEEEIEAITEGDAKRITPN